MNTKLLTWDGRPLKAFSLWLMFALFPKCCSVRMGVIDAKAAVNPPPLYLVVKPFRTKPPATNNSPYSEPGTTDFGVSKCSTCEKPASSLKFHIL